MTVDLHPVRKGGLLPAIENRPKLLLTPSFFETVDPTVYPAVYTTPALNYPMDLNDQVGCCVVAGWDHFLQAVHALLGEDYKNLSDAEIVAIYKTQNPNFDLNGSSTTNGPGSDADGGMVIQLLLEEMRRRGLIEAFAAVHTDEHSLRAAAWVFLGVILGVKLQEAQVGEQFDAGTWDYVAGAGFIGGHCVPLLGYDQVVTWAKVVAITDRFRAQQITEAWVAITPAQANDPSFRNKLDWNGFAAAYHQLTGKTLPGAAPTPPAPAPTPPAPPAPTPAQGATFLVSDPVVAQAALALAHDAGLTPDEWLTRELKSNLGL